LTFKSCIYIKINKEREKESIGSLLQEQHNVFMRILILINILKP